MIPGHGVKMLMRKYESCVEYLTSSVVLLSAAVLTYGIFYCPFLFCRLVAVWLSYLLKQPIYSHLLASHRMVCLTFALLSDMKWERCRKNNSNNVTLFSFSLRLTPDATFPYICTATGLTGLASKCFDYITFSEIDCSYSSMLFIEIFCSTF